MDADSFAAGAAAQREADLKLFAQWADDLSLPFWTKLKSWHDFGVGFHEFVRTVPLEKP